MEEENKENKQTTEGTCIPHEYRCDALSCITVGFSLGVAATVAILKLFHVFK